jgi:hypothetical protein
MRAVCTPFYRTMEMRSSAVISLAIAAAFLVSCSTAQPQKAPPAPRETSAAALADVAGDSVETAVIVPADAPNEGIDFQNDWIFDRFGRFRRTGGGTGQLNGRRFEIVEIELPNGSTKKVFFDITENWKTWKRPGASVK